MGKVDTIELYYEATILEANSVLITIFFREYIS